jgi:AcrR family transcriptional regulator
MTSSVEPLAGTRRERARAATVAEIKTAARRLLVAGGAGAISLRAVARELGLSAPALYRYFASHEELVTDVIADLYDELTEAISAARDEVPAGDLCGQLLAVARRLRSWAVAHPSEFELLFAAPVPDLLRVEHDELTPCQQAGMRFGAVFTDLLAELWAERPFPVPDEKELGPELVRQLTVRTGHFSGMPAGAVYVTLNYWTRLYGLICMEVFGQLHWALDDVEPYFEAQLREMATSLGLE